jgi:HSP20 family protein
MSLMKRERRASWPLETWWDQDMIDGAFGDMLRSVFTGDGVFDTVFEGGTHVMRVEEYVEGDTCVIRAELPGIDPDRDVEISVEEGVLHLRAHREERTEEERPQGFRSEFHYGSLTRSIRLPEGVGEADVRATYRDGILEVRVPAPQEVRPPAPVKIPVSRG